SRNIPAWLRRQVLHRDDHRCTFAGCDMRRFLQVHHIKPWPGPTNLDNLVTLCHFHHKLVHEYGWSVRLGSIPGTADWFRPDKTPYEPKPVAANRAPPQEELPPVG
ncbi:MAG: HNH endonuclease, partial [Actinomycetota bacterium]|nr:HNH endonuclease [Actinomycetota bacterium]